MISERQHPILVRLADGLIRARVPLLLGGIVLTLLAISPARRLALDESIESFYAPDDPDLLAWLESKRNFGGDEFVMVAYEDPELLSAQHLSELKVFADQFRDPSRVAGIDHKATKDLASMLDLDNVPMFRDLSRVGRIIVGRVLRGSIIDFSRSVFIGEKADALLPYHVAQWQRVERRAHAEVPLPGEGDEFTGLHAVYERDGARLDVYALELSPRDMAATRERLIAVTGFAQPPSSPHAQPGSNPDDATETEEAAPLAFSLESPPRRGVLVSRKSWLFLFLSPEADVGAFQETFFQQSAPESYATAVMLEVQPDGTDGIPRAQTLRQIRQLAAAHDPPAYVAGEPVQIHDMFRYVEQDAAVLGWATSAILLLVVLVMFRSLRWVALPLLVVQAAILWTRALLVLSHLKLSMVSSMLNALVTIIGIATVTHVTISYRELRRDLDRTAAFRETCRRLAPAIFWTAVTTAIGFLSLLASEIVPVRSLGLMIALGTVLILVACAAFLPGGILLGRLDADPRTTPAEHALVRMLLAVVRRVDQQPKRLLAACGLLFALGAVGLSRLQVETDFSKNFRSSSEIARAIDFFEAKLGGAGNWEVNFPAPGTLDEPFLERVRVLGRRMREIEMSDGTKLSKAYALTDGLDFVPASMGATIDDRRRALRQLQPDFEDQLYNPQAGRMRLYLRAPEQKPAEIKLALIDEVERTARSMFPEARTTGLYVMIAKLITSLLADQLNSFFLSAVGIVVCMTLAFRSVWIGFASLLPNVFPIVVVIGGMGWVGVPINIGTAMIACVSMGLTIDSSIHYLSGYRRARRQGADHAAAVRETHADVGRSLVFANVALVAGFSVLSLSNFIPLIYFGVLVSLAMLGGLLGNLVLLPLLLRWAPLRY